MIHTGLSNMKIPYQRYTEYSFDDIHIDIREFHAKQQYALINSLINRAQLLPNFHYQKISDFVGKEIEFWPGLNSEVNLPKPQRSSSALVRRNSHLDFYDELPLSFEVIAQFVSDALTCTDVEGGFQHRMYPSGGALYLVEVFLCRLSSNTPGWHEDQPVYHLKANSRCLESMSVNAITDFSELRKCLSGYDSTLGRPHFALCSAIFRNSKCTQSVSLHDQLLINLMSCLESQRSTYVCLQCVGQ